MSTIETTARGKRGPDNWLDAATEEKDQKSDLPFTPREGWLSVIALVVMMFVVALAIDDAGWAGDSIGTQNSETAFLPFGALISVVMGILLSKSTLSIRRINLIGILTGAAAMLLFVSASVSQADDLFQRLRDLDISVQRFMQDTFVLGARSTESSVFLLLLGAIVWGAGIFCAVAVFRRDKPLPAIALSGGILLLNVSLTVREQYLHLLVFAAAALALAVRLNLREQALEWRVRGMRDVGDISASFMHSGAVFVAAAVIGSSLLAANASSAPLSRAWSNWDDQIVDFGSAVGRWLGGVTGSARGPNVLFSPSQTIRDFWQSSSDEVFTAQISDNVGRKWRGATYDSFDGHSWQQLDRQDQVIDAGALFLGDTPESVLPGFGRKEVTVSIDPADYGGDVFVAPAAVEAVSQPTELTTRGENGAFVSGKLSYGIQPGSAYQVKSLVPVESGDGALTANALAATGMQYPDWVKPYLDIRPDSIGDAVYATAQQIFNSLPAAQRDPYHVAVAVQDYLYSGGGFSYTTDVRGLCGDQKIVDCFLQIKKGYCEYFATAMTMMLRTMGIPARYVLGYLPGQQQADGSWRIDRGAAHAWVEVYFPRYGWVEFDPTPGNGQNGQQPTHLPVGGPGPSGSPDVQFPQQPDKCLFGQEDCNDNTTTPPVVSSTGGGGSPGSGLLLMLLVFGGVVAGAGLLAWTAWRRTPSSQPEIAYSGIARIAARLGYGPRPSQTTYEYAARLAELVPVAKPDLDLIATAKVEAIYARRDPGVNLMLSIVGAYRRIRSGLLRLMLRRPRLGLRPRAARRQTAMQKRPFGTTTNRR